MNARATGFDSQFDPLSDFVTIGPALRCNGAIENVSSKSGIRMPDDIGYDQYPDDYVG